MMQISPLQQAKCADRSIVSSEVNPGAWVTPLLPSEWELLTFHFFVQWGGSKLSVDKFFWMTRLVRLESSENLSDVLNNDLLREFVEGPEISCFHQLERMGLSCKKNVAGILLPEVPLSSIHDQTPVWVVGRLANNELGIKRISISRLKEEIRTKSGGPVKIGDKGLTYGTSAVECFLSTSDSAFPGDADAVIVDENGSVRCIIEYKKHTLPNSIGDYQVSRFYPHPDGRKYRRLDALASDLGKDAVTSVPLIVLYYSTREPVVRVQQIALAGLYELKVVKDSGDVVVRRGAETISKIFADWLGVDVS